MTNERAPLAFGEGFTKYTRGWLLLAGAVIVTAIRYYEENARIAAIVWKVLCWWVKGETNA